MAETRNQLRAAYAYDRLDAVKRDDRLKDYKILVNSMGPNVVRSGLVAAVAFLQRTSSRERERFGRDLAQAFPHTLEMGDSLDTMARRVRKMSVQDYMIATRECLHIVQWFKRAAQALDPEGEHDA